MTLTTRIVANGVGWQASEVVCNAGPADAPFEEQHASVCMAVVLSGTFGYRSSRGAATLAPGAILLGNAGDCFECGHQHSVGDRCLSFNFDPAFYESIRAGLPGAGRSVLNSPAVPPQACVPEFLPRADALLGDPTAIEELAIDLAAAWRRGSPTRHLQRKPSPSTADGFRTSFDGSRGRRLVRYR